MENEQGEREREIENVSGEPQVNFIISASSKVHIVNLPNTATLSFKEMWKEKYDVNEDSMNVNRSRDQKKA